MDTMEAKSKKRVTKVKPDETKHSVKVKVHERSRSSLHKSELIEKQTTDKESKDDRKKTEKSLNGLTKKSLGESNILQQTSELNGSTRKRKLDKDHDKMVTGEQTRKSDDKNKNRNLNQNSDEMIDKLDGIKTHVKRSERSKGALKHTERIKKSDGKVYCVEENKKPDSKVKNIERSKKSNSTVIDIRSNNLCKTDKRTKNFEKINKNRHDDKNLNKTKKDQSKQRNKNTDDELDVKVLSKKGKVTGKSDVVEDGGRKKKFVKSKNLKSKQKQSNIVLTEVDLDYDEVDSACGENIRNIGIRFTDEIVDTNRDAEVEFMSTDSESESLFEVERKKLRFSSDRQQPLQKTKDGRKSRKTVKDKAVSKSNNSKNKKVGEKGLSNLVEESVQYEPKAKVMKLTDEVIKNKSKITSTQKTKLSSKMKSRRINSETNKTKISSKSGSKKIDSKTCKKKVSSKKSSERSKKHEKTSPVKKSDHDALSQIDHSDVTAVLLHMEGGMTDFSLVKPGTSREEPDIMENDSTTEEEDTDWEEVEDHPSHKSPVKSQVPKEPIEITIDAPEILKKRQKKEFDWAAYVQRKMNRFKKELREDIHKVHLMCLMARGMYLNRICNHVEIQAVALSLVQEEFVAKSKQLYHTHVLHKLFKWMKSTIIIDTELNTDRKNLANTLTERFQKRKAASVSEFVMLFVMLLRSLGLDVRLVLSLQPLSMKDTSAKRSPDEKTKSRKSGNSSSKNSQNRTKNNHLSVNSKQSEKQSKKQILKEAQSRSSIGQTSRSTGNNRKSDKGDVKSLKGKKEMSEKIIDKESLKNSNFKTKNKTLRVRGSKVKPGSYTDDGDDEDSEENFEPDYNDDSDEDEPIKKKSKKRRKSTEIKSKYFKESENIVESDFEEDKTIYRTPTLKKKLAVLANRKILSDDEDSVQVLDEEKVKQGCDQWVEVYVEAERKWLCFDCVKGQINKPYEIESCATQPVHYVLAYDNEGIVKDVTARYASKWMTDTRKLRVNPEWWEETLDPYVTYNKALDEKEDEEIKSNLIGRPLPTSIAAFKSHPLYVLTRHLLKFEAIYPETAIPLGYIKREPIYDRECVHTLHSRENWLKEGRAVRLKEEPYKMVKSRPKWKQPKANPDALDLECFGIWQTEKYIPPPVIDGKIPRNVYGNLELFKPWMLPLGTVHLQVPGLNKVAKKLNMDCVPAMVGWDTHCGFSHPLLDGFIVCEEDKDILLAAWDEDQEIQKQRETEKREKRAYGNWKLLIKGLLIRERLQKRYDLDSKNDEKGESKMDGGKADDYEMSWPRKQQDEKTVKSKSKSSHFKVESM